MDDWCTEVERLKQPGDDERALVLFGPNEDGTNLVKIEGSNKRNGPWQEVAGPLPANDALNATIQLHRKYTYLRFVLYTH